jgi:hypothetical protein
MITCDAVSVSLYRNTGVSLSRHAVTHDFAGALTARAVEIAQRYRRPLVSRNSTVFT